MRRGIREEQYNNRYTNVKPLVPRYAPRRHPRAASTATGSELDAAATSTTVRRGARPPGAPRACEAVAVCFMNSFANPAHEQAAAELVRRELPDAYLSVSTDVLPSIRFYERVSTTALNAYVGPKLEHYLEQLVEPAGRRRLRRPAADHAVQRRRDLAAGGAREGGADAAVRPGRRPRRRAVLRRARTARTAASPPTWAAPASRPRWRSARRWSRTTARSRGTRSRCRCSTSTPSAPAAARSAGSTRAACCAWARRAPAPTRDRPATAAAARCRPPPTPTSCSAISTRTSSPAARCGSTSPRRGARSSSTSPSRWA